MKSIKQVLTLIITVVAFASTASAYTVSITDTFIGGNPGGGTNSNTSWDGKDVVGEAKYFGIDKMDVNFAGSALDSIKIYTNYVDYLGLYDTHLGDLFISTNGYTTPTVDDTYLTGEQWEYALSLNATSEVHSKNFRGLSGTLVLYSINNSNVELSHGSGTYRNYQEVEIKTGQGGKVNIGDVGTWTIDQTTNSILFDLNRTGSEYFADYSDFGFRWGMSCGNDVIEGGATAPVPEPGTMMLLGAGMLGLAVFGKRRMNKNA